MDQEMITSLAEELKVSKDLARMAINEAAGELTKAREILDALIPQYLCIKAQFHSQRSKGGSGLVFIIKKKNAHKFLIFRTIYEKNREWAKNFSVHRPPDVFLRIIKDYFEIHSGDMPLFDAQKLKDGLAPLQDAVTLQHLFELWDNPKTNDADTADTKQSLSNPGSILKNLISSVLNEALVDTVNLELDYDFYSDSQFNAIRENFGLLSDTPDEEKNEELTEEKEKDEIKVYLKGRFMLDPVNGIPVHELNIGDTVYIEILDRTQVAKIVGEVIGAYKSGYWLPIRGKISETDEAVGDSTKFRLHVGHGAYVNVISINDLKVRSFHLTFRERITKAQEDSSNTSMTPILVAVALLAFLIMVLLMLR